MIKKNFTLTPLAGCSPGLLLSLLLFVSLSFSQNPVPQVNDFLGQGNVEYDKGHFDKAIELYQKAIQQKQQSSFAWFNIGNCRVQLKKLPEALVAYKRSIELAPAFTRPWLLMGDVYFSLGGYGAAFTSYNRYIESEGPDFHAFQMMGECALKSGDKVTAMYYLEKALRLEPDAGDIYLALAEAHASIRDYPAAIDALKDAALTLKNPSANLYFYLGQLYELNEQKMSAIRAYEEGLSMAPKRREYYLRIAELYEQDGSDYLAILTLEEAIRAGLDNGMIRLERGRLYFEQKRYDKALEEFKLALNNGIAQARRGIENVAAAYYNSGKKELSKQAYALLK